MAMANMNLIGVFVTTLWPVQAETAAAETKNIISLKFSNFGDIIIYQHHHSWSYIVESK